MPELIEIARMRRDADLQSRVKTNPEQAREYGTIMKENPENHDFPPVDLIFDGVDYWVWHGFHRIEGATIAGFTHFLANVEPGTRRDALLLSVGANAKNGLHRSNADKRRAVEILLRDEEWSKFSLREIGDRTGVTAPTIRAIKAELAASGVKFSQETVGKDGKIYKNIPKICPAHKSADPDIEQARQYALNHCLSHEIPSAWNCRETEQYRWQTGPWEKLDINPGTPAEHTEKIGNNIIAIVIHTDDEGDRLYKFSYNHLWQWKLEQAKQQSTIIETDIQPGQTLLFPNKTSAFTYLLDRDGIYQLYSENKVLLPMNQNFEFVEAFQQGENRLVKVLSGKNSHVVISFECLETCQKLAMGVELHSDGKYFTVKDAVLKEYQGIPWLDRYMRLRDRFPKGALFLKDYNYYIVIGEAVGQIEDIVDKNIEDKLIAGLVYARIDVTYEDQQLPALILKRLDSLPWHIQSLVVFEPWDSDFRGWYKTIIDIPASVGSGNIVLNNTQPEAVPVEEDDPIEALLSDELPNDDDPADYDPDFKPPRCPICQQILDETGYCENCTPEETPVHQPTSRPEPTGTIERIKWQHESYGQAPFSTWENPANEIFIQDRAKNTVAIIYGRERLNRNIHTKNDATRVEMGKRIIAALNQYADMDETIAKGVQAIAQYESGTGQFGVYLFDDIKRIRDWLNNIEEAARREHEALKQQRAEAAEPEPAA